MRGGGMVQCPPPKYTPVPNHSTYPALKLHQYKVNHQHKVAQLITSSYYDSLSTCISILMCHGMSLGCLKANTVPNIYT